MKLHINLNSQQISRLNISDNDDDGVVGCDKPDDDDYNDNEEKDTGGDDDADTDPNEYTKQLFVLG